VEGVAPFRVDRTTAGIDGGLTDLAGIGTAGAEVAPLLFESPPLSRVQRIPRYSGSSPTFGGGWLGWVPGSKVALWFGR
jgi:hypothetical protein